MEKFLFSNSPEIPEEELDIKGDDEELESINANDELPVSRRGFVAGAAAVAVTALGTSSAKASPFLFSGLAEVLDTSYIEKIPEQTELTKWQEMKDSSPELFSRIMGKSLKYFAKPNEIYIVDERTGEAVTPLIEIRDYIKTLATNEGEKMEIIRANMNAHYGVPRKNPGTDWTTELKARLHTRNPELANAPLEIEYGSKEFRAYLNDPDVRRKMESGEIEYAGDILIHESNKPFSGNYEQGMREYIQEKLSFKPDVPVILAEELRYYVTGLCSQESRYKNNNPSAVGASGLFHFMPDTWASYGGEKGNFTNFDQQIENAGKYLSDIYRTFDKLLGDRLDELSLSCDTKENFLKYVMTPLVLNAYNCGQGTMIDAVKFYMQSVSPKQRPRNGDLYIAISDFARESKKGHLSNYGPQSHEYARLVMAKAQAINGLSLESEAYPELIQSLVAEQILEKPKTLLAANE